MPRSLEEDCFGEYPKRRKSINGKVKGSANERNARKPLEDWTGERFTRVPMSGAMRLQNVERTVSDLMPDTTNKNFYFPFVIETKSLKSIHIPRVLSKSSKLFSIWNQVSSDALRANKLPMAMLRYNHMPTYEYYLILEVEYGGRILSMANVPVRTTGFNGKYQLIGFLMSDVIKHVPYKTFAKVLQKTNFASRVYHVTQ